MPLGQFQKKKKVIKDIRATDGCKKLVKLSLAASSLIPRSSY